MSTTVMLGQHAVPVFQPNTCSTCPFSLRVGGGRECHGGVPSVHVVPQPGGMKSITTWPKVRDDEWCAVHPHRRTGVIQG
jgi:hypothetical protein